MATYPAQTFTITPAQFHRLVETAGAAGIHLEGTSGTATKDGITLEWSYDATPQTLTIQCTSAPAYIPAGMITSRIQSLVTNSLA